MGRNNTAGSMQVATVLVTLLSASVRVSAQEAQPPPDEASVETVPRRIETQSWSAIGRGPFRSARLFTMPVADVVGAYQLSASGDSSLVAEPGVLSTTSVLAVGVGDIAQLEYRSEAATTTTSRLKSIPLPSLGVQFKVPMPERTGWPSVAVALRLGLFQEDIVEGAERDFVFEERVTDVYLVSRLPLWGWAERLTLHAGLRLGQASIKSGDPRVDDLDEYVYLPAGGWELQVSPRARIVGELASVPAFEPGADGRSSAVTSKPFGRLGMRWLLHPTVVLDASMGYRIETTQIDSSTAGLNALVDWDIRIGGEVFVPWGAIACRAGGILCE